MLFSGFNDDPEFQGEANFQRTTFDKANNEVGLAGEERLKPPEGADDLFAAEDAGTGEQFMAVKPWIGAVIEPESRKFQIRFMGVTKIFYR
jgi:hypothetical protein